MAHGQGRLLPVFSGRQNVWNALNEALTLVSTLQGRPPSDSQKMLQTQALAQCEIWHSSERRLWCLPLVEKNLEKNTFFVNEDKSEEDFEFNQDFEEQNETRSPGWIRYQKRIK